MKTRKILIMFLLLSGSVLIMYPGIRMMISASRQSAVVEKIESDFLNLDKKTAKKELAKAKDYNNSIMGSEIKDPFLPGSGIVLPNNYMDILNIDNGIMGILEIPSIQVKLPIYHGTSEYVLSQGVGHLKETAFPIGQSGCHAVLSTHRGLPEAKLFTDLDKLENGDLFYIHICNEILAYRVDQIHVVKPNDTRYLKPVEKEDHVTLLTCTPYGINSHRLMVRGIRTVYRETEKKAITSRVLPLETILALIPAAAILLYMFFVILVRNRRK